MATSPELAAALPEEAPAGGASSPFEVTLENFTGPFDLLLSLIAKHRLDITEVALAEVTDEFIAHLDGQAEWDLGQASEFLVVAATLLDLKAARLLPRGAVESEEDLELLEARDLLFARLLQYRAYKEVADDLAQRWQRYGRSLPRAVSLEPHLAALLPELVMRIGPHDLARLAAATISAQPVPPELPLAHLHAPVVPVAEQAELIVARLRRRRSATFADLTHDAAGTAVVVARFLALLELFREGVIAFDQPRPLGELLVRWTGSDDGEITLHDDYDDYSPAPEPAAVGSQQAGGSDD